MSNKPKKVTKKFIREVINTLQHKMLLSHYELTLFWAKEDENGYAMTVDTNVTYQRASLYVYPTVFTGTREEFIEYAKHELVHIIIQPIVDIAEEHSSFKRVEKPMENAVEHLRKLIDFK